MLKVITELQKHEIEQLATDHADALIAFGADLYRKGLIKGVIIGACGMFVGAIVRAFVDEVKGENE